MPKDTPKKPGPATVDEYIAQQSADVQQILNQTRKTIRAAAPNAKEKISWGMPTYTLNGNLVHFAAQKHHLGFYPGEEGIAAFQKQLAAYKTSKGAAQFPYAQPIPYDLISAVTLYRVQQQG